MLGAQVAVAVPHQSGARPRIEPGASGGKEAVGEALGGIEPLGVQDSHSRPPEGGQVLLQSVLQNPNVAKLGRRGGRLGVEARQPARDGLDVGWLELAPAHERGEASVLLNAAHLDRVLDRGRVVLGGGREAIPPADDPDNAQIDLRGEAAVEPDFLAAHLAAALERPVVEERKDDRLLHLVGAVAGQEDPRGVGFAELDRFRDAWVEAGLEHRLHELRPRHLGDAKA
jgi:hypothetical protein